MAGTALPTRPRACLHRDQSSLLRKASCHPRRSTCARNVSSMGLLSIRVSGRVGNRQRKREAQADRNGCRHDDGGNREADRFAHERRRRVAAGAHDPEATDAGAKGIGSGDHRDDAGKGESHGRHTEAMGAIRAQESLPRMRRPVTQCSIQGRDALPRCAGHARPSHRARRPRAARAGTLNSSAYPPRPVRRTEDPRPSAASGSVPPTGKRVAGDPRGQEQAKRDRKDGDRAESQARDTGADMIAERVAHAVEQRHARHEDHARQRRGRASASATGNAFIARAPSSPPPKAAERRRPPPGWCDDAPDVWRRNWVTMPTSTETATTAQLPPNSRASAAAVIPIPIATSQGPGSDARACSISSNCRSISAMSGTDAGSNRRMRSSAPSAPMLTAIPAIAGPSRVRKPSASQE